METPKKTVAYAYVGVWRDNTLGWNVPCFLHTNDTEKLPAKPYIMHKKFVENDDEFHLVKITITKVRKSKFRKTLIRTAKGLRATGIGFHR